jgi:hypothetical protein
MEPEGLMAVLTKARHWTLSVSPVRSPVIICRKIYETRFNNLLPYRQRTAKGSISLRFKTKIENIFLSLCT